MPEIVLPGMLDKLVHLGREREKHIPQVLHSWYIAERDGNLLLPQKRPGVDILVGNAVIAEALNRKGSKQDDYWMQFLKAELSQKQIEETKKMTTQVHRSFGIRFIPAGYAKEGEVEIQDSRWSELWHAARASVLRTILGMTMDIQTGDIPDYDYFELINEQNVQRIAAIFSTEKYRERILQLSSLYKAAADFLQSQEGKRLGVDYKQALAHSEKLSPRELHYISQDKVYTDPDGSFSHKLVEGAIQEHIFSRITENVGNTNNPRAGVFLHEVLYAGAD